MLLGSMSEVTLLSSVFAWEVKLIRNCFIGAENSISVSPTSPLPLKIRLSESTEITSLDS